MRSKYSFIVGGLVTVALSGCAGQPFAIDNRVILHEKSGSRALYAGRAKRDSQQQDAAIAAFRNALKSGYPAIRTEAARELAQLLYQERGVYDKEIISLATQAANAKDPAAITMLAQAKLAEGDAETALTLVTSIAQDYVPARRLQIRLREKAGEDVSKELAELRIAYQQAADAGDKSVYLPLAQLYDREQMPFYDSQKARTYYTLAAKQGEEAAYFPLARLARHAGDNVQAVEYYEKAAKAGNKRAVKALVAGYGPQGWAEEDTTRHAYWLEIMAQNGDAHAMMQRGFMAVKQQRETEAADWFSRTIAADHRLTYSIGKKLITHPHASLTQHALAGRYLWQATQAGDKRALPLLKKYTIQDLTTLAQAQQTAALVSQHPEMGDTALSYRLWKAFVRHNRPEEGIIWLKRAATGGSLKAMTSLADYYRTGQYVEMDPAKAHDYTVLAAKRGDSNAAYQAGLGYGRGIGVEKDTEKARYWLGKASKGGIKDADAMLGSLDGQ